MKMVSKLSINTKILLTHIDEVLSERERHIKSSSVEFIINAGIVRVVGKSHSPSPSYKL